MGQYAPYSTSADFSLSPYGLKFWAHYGLNVGLKIYPHQVTPGEKPITLGMSPSHFWVATFNTDYYDP